MTFIHSNIIEFISIFTNLYWPIQIYLNDEIYFINYINVHVCTKKVYKLKYNNIVQQIIEYLALDFLVGINTLQHLQQDRVIKMRKEQNK